MSDRFPDSLALVLALAVVGALPGSVHAQDPAPASPPPAHLFILSGQSNMVGLRPSESFTPIVTKALAPAQVLVVKDAAGGQPIRRWFKKWQPADGDPPKKTGDLYDRLMKKVQKSIAGRQLLSVTFVWMQGERDAREGHGDVYAKSLRGLVDQLARDLGRDDVNLVIGRLSDFDLQNTRYRHWTRVREAQVEVATARPRSAWVDTDDLNDGKNRQGKPIANDLHYSAKGYATFGKRCAVAALKLVRGR